VPGAKKALKRPVKFPDPGRFTGPAEYSLSLSPLKSR